MGIGDDIITLSEIQQLYQQDQLPRCPQQQGRTIHKGRDLSKSVIYEQQCEIAVSGVSYEIRPNGLRRYQQDHLYQLRPARIQLTPAEQQWAQQQATGLGQRWLIINPDAKYPSIHAHNKHWPHWQSLVQEMNNLGYVCVRLRSPKYHNSFAHTVEIETDSFRKVLAMIQQAPSVITTDGAVHHAAAAFDRPCVVIWGHCTHPAAQPNLHRAGLGYRGQINIVSGGGPCYTQHRECEQCHEAMNVITASYVRTVWQKSLAHPVTDNE